MRYILSTEAQYGVLYVTYKATWIQYSYVGRQDPARGKKSTYVVHSIPVQYYPRSHLVESAVAT